MFPYKTSDPKGESEKNDDENNQFLSATNEHHQAYLINER